MLDADRVPVQRHADLRLQVVALPQVVVAREDVDRDAGVGNLGQLTQETDVAAGNDGGPLEPELEEVAHQVKGFGVPFPAGIQPRDDGRFPLARGSGGVDTEVKVRSEVDGHGWPQRWFTGR